jgi:hypothetical protein
MLEGQGDPRTKEALPAVSRGEIVGSFQLTIPTGSANAETSIVGALLARGDGYPLKEQCIISTMRCPSSLLSEGFKPR